MSTTAPIERLNYFNGQRLEAADFRIEQDFHMRVRRLLTQSLFTSGIAAGLAVEEGLPKPSHTVQVLPGVALDSLGREIILVEPRDVPVVGKPTEPKEPVTGNYLIIEYAEEATAFAGDGCAVQLGVTCQATEDLAWGAPSRIRGEPRIYIQHQWPKPAENKVVLAQLELNQDCTVREIRKFVRKYVAAAKEAKARTLALEGEKDIDENNPKELFFHIEGAMPDRAGLYLRGGKFSTLYYTELGRHQHALNLDSGDGGGFPAHSHSLNLGDLTTSDDGAHRHEIWSDVEEADEHGIELADAETFVRMTAAGGGKGGVSNMEVTESGTHHHTLAGGTKQTTSDGARPPHHHPVQGTTGNAGLIPQARVAGNAYGFVDGLKIAFDGTDITGAVRAQLQDRDGPGSWTSLGDGTPLHDFVTMGTREIDLLRLGLDMTPGEHRLTFRAPAPAGGKILYNLYIE